MQIHVGSILICILFAICAFAITGALAMGTSLWYPIIAGTILGQLCPLK